MALVETYDGATWSVQPTPNLGGVNATPFGTSFPYMLSGVSCWTTSAGDACMAVGFSSGVNARYTLAEKLA
jgi:hypothetical protein